MKWKCRFREGRECTCVSAGQGELLCNHYYSRDEENCPDYEEEEE